MRKKIYLINSLLAVALFGILIALLSVTHSVAFAATEDSVKNDVSVTGEDIFEGNTYYLQWSNLSVVYNGSSQVPLAVLKCNEDSNFEKTATVSVKNKTGEVVTAVNVGDYVAIAECTGINFGEGENEKEFSISPKSVAVSWDKAESYTYSGQEQGPTARYTDVNGASHTLTASGYGANAGTHTASVTADAAGGNYTLTNLTCGYMISPKSVAVEWDKATSYTYNGQAQGPTASYTDINGTSHTLVPSGLGTNAGTHTVSVTADAAGGNYTLINLTCEYTISQKSVAVDWNKAESYTYSGQAQGPAASYTDVGGVSHTLTASGYGSNAGTYTASITADAAGGNYTLTNLTCGYVIGKLVGKVLWVASDYYIANGQPQAPRAFVVGVNGDFIELPINGAGTKVGEYTAEIDLSKVDSNIELNGETSYRYEIKPENLFGPVGTALSIIFGILLTSSVVFIVYWFCFRKKKADEQQEENEQTVSSLQDDISERDGTISGLQRVNQSLRYDLAEVQDELNRANSSLSTLENELADAQKKKAAVQNELAQTKISLSKLEKELADAHKKSLKSEQRFAEAENRYKKRFSEINSQVEHLTEQVRNLSEENERLKSKIAQGPDFYIRPIEDYLPEIDKSYKYAESCDYDPDDPEGSFITQRQKLRDIMKQITIYRSQRR